MRFSLLRAALTLFTAVLLASVGLLLRGRRQSLPTTAQRLRERLEQLEHPERHTKLLPPPLPQLPQANMVSPVHEAAGAADSEPPPKNPKTPQQPQAASGVQQSTAASGVQQSTAAVAIAATSAQVHQQVIKEAAAEAKQLPQEEAKGEGKTLLMIAVLSGRGNVRKRDALRNILTSQAPQAAGAENDSGTSFWERVNGKRTSSDTRSRAPMRERNQAVRLVFVVGASCSVRADERRQPTRCPNVRVLPPRIPSSRCVSVCAYVRAHVRIRAPCFLRRAAQPQNVTCARAYVCTGMYVARWLSITHCVLVPCFAQSNLAKPQGRARTLRRETLRVQRL